MSFAAYAVAGTLPKLSIAGTPTLIKGVETLTGPGGSKPEIDVTAISDAARYKLGGTPDFGSVKFDITIDPNEATHTALYTSYSTNGSTDVLTIVYPAATGSHTIAMAGSVTDFSWTFAKDQAIKASVGFRLSAQPTIT